MKGLERAGSEAKSRRTLKRRPNGGVDVDIDVGEHG
jgi:hypothetical protein